MVYIASDHAGFQLKKALVTYLTKVLALPTTDLGPEVFHDDDDYPDYAVPLAKKIAGSKADLGILICGSGHGMCIAANKIKGIRAVLATSIESAEFARKEDNANILCLSGRTLSDEHARAIVKAFVEKTFSGEERHVRRLKKIAELE
jgi:ribose 5-phosphate isomerase B